MTDTAIHPRLKGAGGIARAVGLGLHADGTLTDAEFGAAKAKILGT